jgi:hypothetical protein
MSEHSETAVRDVNSIRLLMKQLCEALEALSEGVSLAAPDAVRALLAIRNDVVPVADERLTKCAELIRRGLRDEAVSYASEPPDLVQAATLLDLSGHSRWKVWSAKLAELGIPTPPMPRMDLVAILIKAQDDLARLKPRLDAWRRMNLANFPLPERIEALRKLRRADPENEIWFEALREHQKHRIPALEREVAAAVAAESDHQLHVLVAEMEHEWIEPVPRRIVATAKSALERLHGGRIEREIDALADSLVAAYDARDLDAARTLRARWTELGDQKGAFAVDDLRLMAALPAVGWVDAHARMATVFEELWSSLDGRPGGLRIRQEWVRSLERLGNEMEDLAEKLEGQADVDAIERAHERISRQRAQLEQDLRFRRMIMYVSVVSAAVVLGVGVWYFDDQARYQSSVKVAKRDLQIAQEKIGAGLLNELPDFKASWPARVASNTEVASLLTIVRGELDIQAGRRNRLAVALEKGRSALHAAETAERPDPLARWPSAFADASHSIAEIEQDSLAMTDQEQADAARLRAAVDRLARRFVDQADGFCRDRVTAFDTDLDKARSLVVEDSSAAIRILEALKPAIVNLRAQAAAPAVEGAAASHAGARIASETIIALLSPDGPLFRKVETTEGMHARRRKFREAEAELDRRLGDWNRYAGQLELLAKEFNEIREAPDYARAAEGKTKWLAVDAWRELGAWFKELDQATPEQASETIAKFEALPDAARDLGMAKRIQQDVMPAVKQLAERDLEKLRVDLEEWFSGPWLGELRFVVTTNDGAVYYCLQNPEEGAQKFTYVSGRKDLEAGWPTKDEREVVASVKPSPQSGLADALRAIIHRAKVSGGLAVDQLFVDLLSTVAGAEAVDPVLRLVTSRKLLLLAGEYSRPFRLGGRPLKIQLDDGEGGIPGVTIDDIWSYVPPTRQRDARYLVITKKAGELLRQIKKGLESVASDIATERKLLASPPLGSATLVGRLGRNEAGDLVAVWRGAVPPACQVWWFPGGADAVVAGTVDANGMFRPAPVSAPAGTPLYSMAIESPGAGETKRQAAASRGQ